MEKVLLVGNDINNVEEGYTWANLLSGLNNKFNTDIDFRLEERDKPFPMAYEEFYFLAAQSGVKESEILAYIASHVTKIKVNELHLRIADLSVKNLFTTNYDMSLEAAIEQSNGKKLKRIENYTNKGFVREKRYNVFAHHTVYDKNIWHIHGSANRKSSIILGYEQYSGYLQYLRTYVLTGATYTDGKIPSLEQRLLNNEVAYISWADYFFTNDVHILGLSMDFVETELWWLLASRQRLHLHPGKNFKVNNRIIYYCPKRFDTDHSKAKFDLLRASGVDVHFITDQPGADEYQQKLAYYHKVLDLISS